MNRSVFRIALSLGLAVFAQGFAISQTRDRADIPTELQWKLEAIYPSDEAWNAAKDKIAMGGRFGDGDENSSFAYRILTSKLEPSLELAAEMLRNPTFPDDELEKVIFVAFDDTTHNYYEEKLKLYYRILF